MSADSTVAWSLVAGLAIIAFVTRAIFTMPDNGLPLSPRLERMLRFAPAAALMAIVVPDIARINGVLQLSPDNPRLIAGLAAFAVAALTRNILLTIVVGLAVLATMKVLI